MVIPPDDPIIACMMRTGYPPWMQNDPGTLYDDDDDEYFDDDESYERKEED